MLQPTPTMTLDAELQTRLATTQLVRFHVSGPADYVLRAEKTYWLDLCLTPRPHNARASFSERWPATRFERIGRVFVLPPHEPLRTCSDGAPSQTSVLCHLRPEALAQWFSDELSWTDHRLESGLDIAEPSVRNLLVRLGAELREPGFACEALSELVVAQIAIELARYCTTIDEGKAVGGLATWRLRLIDERLREVRAVPTLSELATLCNLSVRQLARAFRASRGVSIGDHIATCRVEHAKRMLASDESIKAVAYELGFASPSSFSFAFRSATGQAPREFRAQSLGRERAARDD
jgi:AraC family transcriptional regulator